MSLMLHGYSDRIHHALAFTAKHYPEPISRYDGHSCLIRASSIAVILARYGADEGAIVVSILKQLMDACPLDRHASLMGDISTKFGAPVAGMVAAVAEPRFDVLGRTRTWKACRFEYLTRLSAASPRAVDVSVAHELHRLGAALVWVRRLGVEYLQSAGVPHPEETRWWCRALRDTLRAHPTWRRTAMLNEFERLADALGQRLAEVGL